MAMQSDWHNAVARATRADAALAAELKAFALGWLPIVVDKDRQPLFPLHAAREREDCERLWGQPPRRSLPMLRFMEARVGHLLAFVHPVPPPDPVTYSRYAFQWVAMYSMDQLDRAADAPPETEAELDAFRTLVLFKLLERAARRRIRKEVAGQRVSPGDVEAMWNSMMQAAAGQPMEAWFRQFPLGEEKDGMPYMFHAFQMPALMTTMMMDAIVAANRGRERVALWCLSGKNEQMVHIQRKIYPGMLVDAENRVYLMNDAGTAYDRLDDGAVLPFLEFSSAAHTNLSQRNRQLLDAAYVRYVYGSDARSDGMSYPSDDDLRSQEDPGEMDVAAMAVEEREFQRRKRLPSGWGEEPDDPEDMEDDDETDDGGGVDMEDVPIRGSAAPASPPRAPKPREVIVIDDDDDSRTASQGTDVDSVQHSKIQIPAAVPVPLVAVPAPVVTVSAPPAAVSAPPTAVSVALAAAAAAAPAAEPKKKARVRKPKQPERDIVTVDKWRPRKHTVIFHEWTSLWRRRWDEMQRHETWQAVDYALYFNIPVPQDDDGEVYFPQLAAYESERMIRTVGLRRSDALVDDLIDRTLRLLEQLMPAFPSPFNTTFTDPVTKKLSVKLTERPTEDCIAVFGNMFDWVVLAEHGYIPRDGIVQALLRDTIQRRALRDLAPDLLTQLREHRSVKLTTEDYAKRFQEIYDRVPWKRSLLDIVDQICVDEMDGLTGDESGQVDISDEMSLRTFVAESILAAKPTKLAKQTARELELGAITRPRLLCFTQKDLESTRKLVAEDFEDEGFLVEVVRYEYPQGILVARQVEYDTRGRPRYKEYRFVLLPDFIVKTKKGSIRRVPFRSRFYNFETGKFIVLFDNPGEKMEEGTHIFESVSKNCQSLDKWMQTYGSKRVAEILQRDNDEVLPDLAPLEARHGWDADVLGDAEEEESEEEEGPPAGEGNAADDAAAEEEITRKFGKNAFVAPMAMRSMFAPPSDDEDEDEQKRPAAASPAAASPAAAAAPKVNVLGVRRKTAEEKQEEAKLRADAAFRDRRPKRKVMTVAEYEMAALASAVDTVLRAGATKEELREAFDRIDSVRSSWAALEADARKDLSNPNAPEVRIERARATLAQIAEEREIVAPADAVQARRPPLPPPPTAAAAAPAAAPAAAAAAPKRRPPTEAERERRRERDRERRAQKKQTLKLTDAQQRVLDSLFAPKK